MLMSSKPYQSQHHPVVLVIPADSLVQILTEVLVVVVRRVQVVVVSIMVRQGWVVLDSQQPCRAVHRLMELEAMVEILTAARVQTERPILETAVPELMAVRRVQAATAVQASSSSGTLFRFV
jgi:hypothetical protein